MVDALADRAQRNVDDVCRGANQCGTRIFASDHVILMHCPVMIKDLHIQVNLDALPWAFTQDGLDESWLPLLDALVSEGNIPSSDLHYVWLEYGDWLVAACGSNIKVRKKAAQILQACVLPLLPNVAPAIAGSHDSRAANTAHDEIQQVPCEQAAVGFHLHAREASHPMVAPYLRFECASPHLGHASVTHENFGAVSQMPLETELQALCHSVAQLARDSSVIAAHTLVIFTDNREASELQSSPHFCTAMQVWRDRCQLGRTEIWAPVFCPLTVQTGLSAVHYTWGKAFVAEAFRAAFPAKHLIIADHDSVPLALFEVHELVALCRAAAPSAE